MRFVDGLFFGMGNNGTLLTSSDGSNWTTQVTGTTASLYGAAYTRQYVFPPGLFVDRYVVIGSSGTILVSSNAVNWSVTHAGGNLNDVTVADDFQLVAATSRATTTDANTIYSATGLNWATNKFVGGGNPSGGMPYVCSAICFDDYDGALVTAGGTEFADDVWTSYDDGQTWTNSGFSDEAVTGIAYGNRRFIMVGWEGWPYESTNGGNSWFGVASPAIDAYAYTHPQAFAMVGNDIVFANGIFVVAEANMQGTSILVTTNGVDWLQRTPTNSSPTNRWINSDSIAFGNGTYVGVSKFTDVTGTVGPGIYQSMPIGTPFITSSQLTNTNAMDIVISGLIGQKYRLQTSPDLTSWSNLWTYTNTGPTMEYVDPMTTSAGQRFYRVVSP